MQALVVLCALDEVVDPNCNCKKQTGSVPPATMCRNAINCIEGTTPTEVNGLCSCVGDTFTDDTQGVGPIPVDSRAARTSWSRPR